MSNPIVVVVDDRANDYVQGLAEHLSRTGKVDATSVHPADLYLEQLESASLVLVDFKLEEWPTRNALSEIALKPLDGIALAGLLRRQVFSRPPAFALISSNIEDAFFGVSSRNRRHQLARVESLEWVFQKDDLGLNEQVIALAGAVRSLRDQGAVSGQSLETALQIPLQIGRSGLSDVRRCIPPLGDLERITSGLAFIRWMLQRVVPYPTFIVDDLQLCARLKVPPDQLNLFLESKTQLAQFLARFRYDGILSGFAGRRWWKAGLDEVSWVLEQSARPNPPLESQAIGQNLGPVGHLMLSDPVVPVDEDCMPQTTLVERKDCLRLLPDDWPAYADPPYCTIERIKHSEQLRAIVHPEDLWRLEEESPPAQPIGA